LNKRICAIPSCNDPAAQGSVLCIACKAELMAKPTGKECRNKKKRSPPIVRHHQLIGVKSVEEMRAELKARRLEECQGELELEPQAKPKTKTGPAPESVKQEIIRCEIRKPAHHPRLHKRLSRRQELENIKQRVRETRRELNHGQATISIYFPFEHRDLYLQLKEEAKTQNVSFSRVILNRLQGRCATLSF